MQTILQTHQERAPENEWLDIQPHPVFSQDGDSFLLLAGIQETGTEHFTHIKHVTITQQRMSVISHGRYEVRGRQRGVQTEDVGRVEKNVRHLICHIQWAHTTISLAHCIASPLSRMEMEMSKVKIETKWDTGAYLLKERSWVGGRGRKIKLNFTRQIESSFCLVETFLW